jgi:5-methylcytosine-specific restriction protein A
MPSSRTGLTPHLKFRRAVLRRDEANGITHCPTCGTQLDYKISRKPNSAEPDHIIPTSLGGTNDPTNGRTICRRCNQSRGNKTAPTNTRQVKPSPIW